MFISLSEQSPLSAGNELLHHSPKFRYFKKLKKGYSMRQNTCNR